MSADINNNAPALFAILQKIFRPDEIKLIEAAYSFSCNHGGLNEGELNRTVGANFNPRPARIAQILISETKITNSHDIIVAILACMNSSPPITFPQFLIEFAEDSENTQALLNTNNPKFENFNITNIALAIKLDDIRHLHMRNIPGGELSEKLTECKLWLKHIPSHDQIDRLCVMLNSAISRLERNIN